MKVPNEVHLSGPWRIREIASDFEVEDVWELPVEGDAGEFRTFLELMRSSDPLSGSSLPVRFLWWCRDQLGRWFNLGRVSTDDDGARTSSERLPIPGTDQLSLRERLPEDLRGTADDLDFGSLPFEPLFLTDNEFAAEISNQTVHGIMHLAWAAVPEQENRGGDRYRGQLAVYVKPRGRFGSTYMKFIKPFRLWIVYPAMMREMERRWNERPPPLE